MELFSCIYLYHLVFIKVCKNGSFKLEVFHYDGNLGQILQKMSFTFIQLVMACFLITRKSTDSSLHSSFEPRQCNIRLNLLPELV